MITDKIQFNTMHVRHNGDIILTREVPQDASRPAWTDHDFTGRTFMGRRFRTMEFDGGTIYVGGGLRN